MASNYHICSIDIGIKTLSMCIIQKTDVKPFFKIIEWCMIPLANTGGKKSLSCCYQITNRISKANKANKAVESIEPTKKGKSKKQTKNSKTHKCKNRAFVYDKQTNIGYCKIHEKMAPTTIKLERYLTTTNISDFELCKQVIKELEKIPKLLECDEIILEQQIRHNMKKIEYMIFTYLTHKSMEKTNNNTTKIKDIKIVSASHKLAIPFDKLDIVIPSGSKDTYKNRKALATNQCTLLLETQDKCFTDYFNKYNKQDDLADCLLQGISYICK